MNCANCGKGHEAGPLYRVNEKGVPGIFHCVKCLTPEQKSEHEEDIDFCETIHRGTP